MYENETIECKTVIEASTLSDNISLIFIETFHALASTFKPLASDNGKPRGSQRFKAKSETKKLNESREANGL